MCADHNIIENIAAVVQDISSSLHTKCIEILCNLTRFSGNAGVLSRSLPVYDALCICGTSHSNEGRLWTMRSLQNLTADPSTKARLATPAIIDMLRVAATNLDSSEHEAAVSAIANLCTDAVSVVQLTNSKGVVPTLIKIAHNRSYSPEAHFHACNALSRIGVWFQTFASVTSAPAENFSPFPTMVVKGNMRWDCDV